MKARPKRRAKAPERYDHDAHKAQLMDPVEGAVTFLTLMKLQAAIDVATGTDPVERWRVAKEYDRRERAKREGRPKRRRGA